MKILIVDDHALMAEGLSNLLRSRGFEVAGIAGDGQEGVAEALRLNPDLVLMGLPGSVVLKLAEVAGLRTAHEAFADRAYTPEGHLVSRKEKDSVLHDPEQIARRCIAMATGEPILDINGDPLTLRPDSICVHGDTPGAVEIARRVREALEQAGVPLAPFATAG